ncbi:hypothetical protein T11_7785 [Trichinella zimbabwensis]|uniref:MH2 domain-containing protein n=1 Tax=Trichinella zimbabwensis TaxID=268475 RepID=A0A0V1HTZ1_9BILA|nr:hypothetical protein T11_7785 [Trichinella zimbabwensis]
MIQQQQQQQQSCISRSKILYGTSTREAWFSLDDVYKHHIDEVNEKLSSLDDGIWAKLILMEKNRRIAKAYLRSPVTRVDGSRAGFDGHVIGFNSFCSTHNDAQVAEICTKISSGVVLKIDNQGNILAKRRGHSPVIVQGANCPDMHCLGKDVISIKGHLEVQRAIKVKFLFYIKSEIYILFILFKVFDMRLFKEAVEIEFRRSKPDMRKLFYKSVVRISLVKDDPHPLKTPCWIMVINLVALDVLNSKTASSGQRNSWMMTRAQSELDLRTGKAPLAGNFSFSSSSDPSNVVTKRLFMAKLKPNYWASHEPAYESCCSSSSQSFLSNGRSSSPSLLSESFSETQTTDSGFLDVVNNEADKIPVKEGSEKCAPLIYELEENRSARLHEQHRNLCKSNAEIYRL